MYASTLAGNILNELWQKKKVKSNLKMWSQEWSTEILTSIIRKYLYSIYKFIDILILHTLNLKLIKTKAMHPHSLDFKFILDDSIERNWKHLSKAPSKKQLYFKKSKTKLVKYQLISWGKFNIHILAS